MIIDVVASLHVARILGDHPYAEVGEPVLSVTANGLVAMAGEFDHESNRAPVAVYDSGDQRCRARHRSRFPVHAMAFHPSSPLVVVGTGGYDGGYFFEGELLLIDLGTGSVGTLFEHRLGRQVLGLEWLDDQQLRLLMAPPDDWQDRAAWVEGHVAVVRRDDWRAVAPASIGPAELAGPRVPAPRPAPRVPGRPRRNVRAVEELPDGRVLAALSGVAVECWLPSGDPQWRVTDDGDPHGRDGGVDLVVAPDQRSVWSGLLRPTWQDGPQSLVRCSLADGARLDEFAPHRPYALVRSFDGLPVVASAAAPPHTARLRIRRSRRIYVADVERKSTRLSGPHMKWLAVAEPVPPGANGRPGGSGKLRRLFPYSWVPGESHHTGPGAETEDGSLVYAGSVHDGRGLQPGGVFVVRRDMVSGSPRWIFRTDHPATDLDTDGHTAVVAFRDGEIVALDLADGSVRWRCHLPGIHPTALTVPAQGRLLIGTSDGRILDCRITVTGGSPSGAPPY